MRDHTGRKDVWTDLARAMAGRIEGFEPYIECLRQEIDGRELEGEVLARVEGHAYELLLRGLETDVLYLMAQEDRKEAARRFWAAMGASEGDPEKVELDIETLSVRKTGCLACMSMYLGATFETSEWDVGSSRSVPLELN